MKRIYCPNCGTELISTENEIYTCVDDTICFRQYWMCTNCGCDIETYNPIENERTIENGKEEN